MTLVQWTESQTGPQHAVVIHRETLGLRPRDRSCHHEVWLHMDFVDNQYAYASRGNHEQRVVLKIKVLSMPA